LETGRKNVLLLTYYWPPSGGAGVQRWLKFCKYLPQFNVIVDVVTVHKKYASYPVTDESFSGDIARNLKIIKTKSFEPLHFYQRISGRKQVPFAGFANETNENWKHEISRFIRGNFFIPDARRGWNRYAIKAAAHILKKQQIDTVITTSPPHSTQLAGLALKKQFGVKWIADLRDPWTDIYYYDKMNHTLPAKKLDAYYERQVLEQADKVVVVSEYIKQMFLKKSNKINPEKIVVIPNGYDDEDFAGHSAKINPNEIVIAYNGTLSDNYPVGPFLTALKNALQCFNVAPVRMRFTGSVTQTAEQEIQLLLPGRVEFIKQVSHQKSVEILLQSDINLLLIPDVANNEGILTGKLFEYMASKNPIVCVGPLNGNAAAIIQSCEAGETFEKENIEGITNYLIALFKTFTDNRTLKLSNQLYQQYSRKNLSKLMSDLIHE
jgi:glycosyltransferase involved in cell wall biosynthesis